MWCWAMHPQGLQEALAAPGVASHSPGLAQGMSASQGAQGLGKCTHECSAAGIHQLDPTPHRSPSASKPHTRHSLNHLSATACVHGDGLATGMPPSPVLSPVQLPTPQWCPLRSNPHMGWQQEEVAPRVHGRSWEQDAGSIRGVRAWDKSEWSSLTKAVAVCPRGAMLQCVFFSFLFCQ